MLTLFRRTRRIRPSSAAGRTVDQALAELKRMIMDPSTDAKTIIDQVNGLGPLIAQQQATAISAAETALANQHNTDLAAISAAVANVTKSVTPVVGS